MKARNGAFGCVLAASFAAGVIAGVASIRVPSARAGDTEVKIDDFAFLPQRLAVKAGTTVTWINADDSPHTVHRTPSCSSPRRSTPTTGSRSRSRRLVCTSISARFTRT